MSDENDARARDSATHDVNGEDEIVEAEVVDDEGPTDDEPNGNEARDQVEKEFFEKARPSSLLKRFATPDEVAAMVVFICSRLSSATNGAALRVDGGVVRSPF